MKLEDKTYLGVTHTGQISLLETCNIASTQQHLTRGGSIQQSHNLQQGGFAGSTGTDDTDNLPLLNGEVDALEHLQISKSLGYIIDRNHLSN